MQLSLSHFLIILLLTGSAHAQNSGLSDIIGKRIKLVEIQSLRMNDSHNLFLASCNEEQIDKTFANTEFTFGSDTATFAANKLGCYQLTLNMIELYPIDNTKAQLIVGIGRGKIDGLLNQYLYSKPDSYFIMDAGTSSVVTCSITKHHKPSLIGFATYVATSELSTSETLITCQSPTVRGKIVYRVLN